MKKRLISVLVLTASLAMSAMASDWQYATDVFTNAIPSAGAVTNNNKIPLHGTQSGVLISLSTVAANAGTSNAIVTVKGTIDDIAPSGVTPTLFTITNACNGTTEVVTRTQVAQATIANYHYLWVYQANTAQTNAVTAKVKYGYFHQTQ